MGRASQISSQQRREIVLMMLRKDEPVAVLARRYNVSEAALYRWRDDFLQAGKSLVRLLLSRSSGRSWSP